MAIAAYYESYIDYVVYDGMIEKYPAWFREEVLDDIVMDASRYTHWIPYDERPPGYYDKQVVEGASVFLRKPCGDIHCTDYDTFEKLYYTFYYNDFTNSGIAAFEEDIIEYVECRPGILPRESPDWFYEYFTEAVNLVDEETVLWNDSFGVRTDNKGLLWSDYGEGNGTGEVVVDHHCVFMRNFAGSIMYQPWEKFIEVFNPGPNENEFETLDRTSSISVTHRWNYGVKTI